MNANSAHNSDPYCGQCGYNLAGLTESSKCPECGRPIVEVLQRGHGVPLGRRYTSRIVLFGLPLLQVAYGPYGNEARGKAKGIIAMGDIATGWLAIGGLARGVIALGGFSIGVVSFGGMAMGGFCIGGGAFGILAVGGGAIGTITAAGASMAVIAIGGDGLGYYARADGAGGKYLVTRVISDPEAVQLFDRLNPVLSWGLVKNASGAIPLLLLGATIWVFVVGIGLAVILFAICWLRYRRDYGSGSARAP